ncbi:telomeric repeat-binding factor 1 [Stegastes partitus]|uniref:Telomeric repeat-binding factor n=1 Tax=Stegastes partitus TaxID=144197 RepID=A0A3B5AHC6_9TELE|nr:PREDICTED: telomeric repeat-binding factor 1 [Stegastes partitus]
MDPENNNTALEEASVDEDVNFSQVTTVATGWMLDFMFVSLCRRFKEGKLDEFNETLSGLEAITESTSLNGQLHKEKTLICAFLARVMHGKQLDVIFEEDNSVMPLMSAAKTWSSLEHTVADESLFKNITILLLVQSVAVCLEKGQRSSASSALKWFENNCEFPQNFGVKLSKIVAQRDSYHPFLMSFSFSRLLDTIQSFLDAYLEKNPSDYLLKEATKVVQSSQNVVKSEDVMSQENPAPKTTNKSTNQKKKTKRKLLSSKITDVWKPDSCKKLCVSVKRISNAEISQKISEKSPNTSAVPRTRKPHQKWPYHLDQYLKQGVQRHGQGKWALILMDYDFEGRTGTMLKDRWRVLMRTHKVS